MSKKILPFNISLLVIDDELVKGITPVTSLDTYERSTKNFHDDGLFSTKIFGQVGEEIRNRRFSYIDVKAPVIHPTIYRTIVKMKSFYEDIMAGRQYAVWDNTIKQFVKSSPEEGNTGMTFFLKHFHQLEFEDTGSDQRRLFTDLYTKFKNKALVNRIVVIPAGLRDFFIDESGRPQQDEINYIYRRLIAKSNLIDKRVLQSDPEVLDGVIYDIQKTFNELFQYFQTLLDGKKKLILGKWASRKIFNGTRNVISAPIVNVNDLNDSDGIEMDSTQIGLYQYMKSIMPLAINKLKTGFLSKVFVGGGQGAYLVNKKTLRKEFVTLSPETLDLWTTNTGIEKTITKFAERSIRDSPVIIEDFYLGLIYKDQFQACLIQDISEIEGVSDENGPWKIENVRPVTYSELYYMAIYKDSKKYPAFVTRYPITGFGSIYPSIPYLRTTIGVEVLKEVEIINGERKYPEEIGHMSNFPIRFNDYFDTISPSEYNLALLGADFDGDVCSFNVVYSVEAQEEVAKFLESKRFYLNTSGKLAFGASTNNANLVLSAMTSKGK